MRRTVVVAVVVLAMAAGAGAELLTAWDVLGVNAATIPVLTNSYTAANIISNSAVLRLGAGITASGAADSFGGTSVNEASLVDAIAANDYFSWYVEAGSGYGFAVTNIAFNMNRTGTGASNIVIRSSVDGFSVDLFTLNNFPATSGGGDSTFALSLAVTNSVEFRLYAWSGGVGTTRFRQLSGGDLSVYGTIEAIPEPTTVALLGLSGVLLVRGFRRLRRKA